MQQKTAEILQHRVVTTNMYWFGRDDTTYLTTQPAKPTRSAEFDREKAAQWVASHENAKWRGYAQQMIDHLQYVSFTSFHNELVTCMQRVNALYREQNIRDDEIIILVPFIDGDKSNPWVASLALPLLEITPKFIISTTPPEILKNYLQLNPGVKRLIAFDDASYSGVDLSSSLGNALAYAREINPAIELDIVVPYVTQHAKARLSEKGQVISQQIMPSLIEVLTIDGFDQYELEQHLCARTQRNLNGLTLTYFDHKLADSYSVPGKCLRDGKRIDASRDEESGIIFIPAITPPYKESNHSQLWQAKNDRKMWHSVAHIMTEAQCKERLLARFKLHNAAKHLDVDEIRKLLAEGFSPCAFDNQKRSALSYAIEKGDKTCFELLLEHCENINFTNPNGETMVHECAQYANLELLKILIAKKAKLNIPFSGQVTPLSHCIQYIALDKKRAAEFFPIFKLLTQHDTHIDFDDIYDDVAEVQYNAINSIARLLTRYHQGSNHLLTMLTLIAKPMDLLTISHCRDRGDYSPLFGYVIFNRHRELQNAVCKLDVNITDDTGASPLMYAVLLGRKECVATLLEHGAQIECKTYDARVLAKLSDQHEILAMLNKSEVHNAVF